MEFEPNTRDAAPTVWQFSLRELFGLTTFAACATAIANAWDPGTLVAAVGCLVTWMNYRGRCQLIQVGLGRWLAVVAGTGLFVGSMFLPAFRAWGDMAGWKTAWTMIVLAVPPFFTSVDYEGGQIFGYMLHLPWLLFTDTANLAATLVPLTLLWKSARLRRIIGTAMHATAPTVWLLIIGQTKSYLSGYYVWALAITILASTLPIDRRTARIMLVATSIFGVTRILANLMQTAL